jgi:RNA polymerase sigma-70 factor (ECF subfamily)
MTGTVGTSSEGSEKPAAEQDGELLRLIASGNEAALSRMMGRYSARVYSTAFRVLRRRPESQEVTQDVFLALWRSPDRFRVERGALPTWLAILSRSRALDLLRHLQTHASREDELTSELLDRNPALRQPANCDQEILIGELLNRLPQHQSWLVQKIYLEGWGVNEMATLQGTPLGTIKSRARVAMKRLRSEFVKS